MSQLLEDLVEDPTESRTSKASSRVVGSDEGLVDRIDFRNQKQRQSKGSRSCRDNWTTEFAEAYRGDGRRRGQSGELYFNKRKR